MRKAFGWRRELLDEYSDGTWIWGDYEDNGDDGVEPTDLVRVVSIDGVYVAVPVELASLTDYERGNVRACVVSLAAERAEYEAGDHGDC